MNCTFTFISAFFLVEIISHCTFPCTIMHCISDDGILVEWLHMMHFLLPSLIPHSNGISQLGGMVIQCEFSCMIMHFIFSLSDIVCVITHCIIFVSTMKFIFDSCTLLEMNMCCVLYFILNHAFNIWSMHFFKKQSCTLHFLFASSI